MGHVPFICSFPRSFTQINKQASEQTNNTDLCEIRISCRCIHSFNVCMYRLSFCLCSWNKPGHNSRNDSFLLKAVATTATQTHTHIHVHTTQSIKLFCYSSRCFARPNSSKSIHRPTNELYGQLTAILQLVCVYILYISSV